MYLSLDFVGLEQTNLKTWFKDHAYFGSLIICVITIILFGGGAV
jgi:hypothetical protein